MGNAQTVDPAETVAEEQQVVLEPIVVEATQEPVVEAYPDALQPTVAVVIVEQDDTVPEEAHTTLVIVAVEPEQDELLDDELAEVLADLLAD